MAKQFRFLRDNPMVHRFITFQMKQRKLNAEGLGNALGIYPFRIRNYMKKNQPSLTDSEIVKICEHLRIKLKLEVELYV